MLPDFETFRKVYMKFALLAVFGFSWLMTFSLVRNNPNIDVITLTLSLTVIFSVFVWNMMRDNRSYWTYTFLTLRIWETFEFNEMEINNVLNARNRWIYEKHLAVLFVSLRVAFVTGITAVIVSNINGFSPHGLSYLALILGGLLYPLFMGWMLKHAITCNLFLILQSQAGKSSEDSINLTVNQTSLWRLVLEDTLNCLLITLVLVLPIYQKPEFSLVNGYLSPEFIVGFIILQTIVLFFILMFAKRDRRVNFLGDLFNGALIPSQNRLSRLFDWLESHTELLKKSAIWRFIIYSLFISVWALISCVMSALTGLSDISSEHSIFPFIQFALVYLIAICAPLLIFMFERYHSLKRNLAEAKEMEIRHQFYQARFNKTQRLLSENT